MSQIKESPPQTALAFSPPIELPSESLADLKKLAALDEAMFSSLLKAIAESEPALTVSQLARKIGPKVSGIANSDLRAVLIAAINLHAMRVRSSRPRSIKEHVERVIGSKLLTEAKDLTPENKATLVDRLNRLLSIDAAIGITAKAQGVMTDHDHTFCNARILSDIRPIFSESGDTAAAAVIIHNLRIGYHQDGKHQDFYVALDTDDIKKLKEAIERAEKKTATLENILKQSHISYLEV